ncbi:SIP domain-containing protein [Cyclobacterium marinum]|uniref:Siderophore-interacting protein n=1 Tax=Cyclobacterium marinum (strain ATCC 25205 / DSM 745 / LMG 13164 / NCIMB 1802) TaxID=880070 RepID=G0IZ46_CYCMS|nr:SIP domain-containing protein [Cyclobacterium marinum]AEL23825.1 Siderophore-interacting protein [Cyclobacterium marinum DSM 745]
MGIIENIIKKVVLQEALIVDKTKLSEAVYKIRLKSDTFTKVDFVPGYFLRLGIGIGKEDLSMKDKIRSYSVWDLNIKEGFLDLAIATHSKGIGAQWVEKRQPGDQVYFKWKKGKFLVDHSADSYLMVGDLSALSHLYVIQRNLEKGKQIEGIIYSSNKKEMFSDTDKSKPFGFYEMPLNPQKEIIALIKEKVEKMEGKKMVYIAGDSRICVQLNNFFRKELGWDSNQVKTKPFWNPQKKGLE